MSVINSSYVLLFIILYSIILNLVSLSSAAATTYDDFSSASYTLSDGQTSPDGKWLNIYNGGGASGISVDGGKKVFFIYPKVSTSQNETNANLVKSTQQLSNFRMDVNVKTVEQLRRNNSPNTWEAAWIFFRYTDAFHHYWVVLKPTGLELGKKDCDKCTDPVEGQIYLQTTDHPNLKIGDWSHWKITAAGSHIRVDVNGTRVIDFVDHNMSHTLSQGSIGFYTEDAYAEYNNINITAIKSRHLS